ncbi:TetR/AcrR family transcriptional regulator [Rhizobium leguminosarum]|nr:TetR/AcrR family transcriptional regulator [Rhizobium leguminosarum]
MTAAERLFLEKGVELTTIEEITTGAGVAKGTFYLHFSSKADVLRRCAPVSCRACWMASLRRSKDGDKRIGAGDWRPGPWRAPPAISTRPGCIISPS